MGTVVNGIASSSQLTGLANTGDKITVFLKPYGPIFLFFNTFSINMILQYKQVGKWKDYLYGERAYIWLSLLAKTCLAWQVFFGTYQPN